MEEYAGGSTENYETSRNKLLLARRYLGVLSGHAAEATAGDGHGLMRVHDTLDRILLAQVLVEQQGQTRRCNRCSITSGVIGGISIT